MMGRLRLEDGNWTTGIRYLAVTVGIGNFGTWIKEHLQFYNKYELSN